MTDKQMNTGKAILYTAMVAAAAVSGAGCGDSGGGGGGSGPTPPSAMLDANPNPGRKLEDITFDASASVQGSSAISKYTFDFGDGSPVYEETSASAPDGAFDGITTHQYADAADVSALVTVTDDNNETDTASVDVDVGYNADSAGAIAQSSATLTGLGYTPTEDYPLQLLDPVNGMTAFDALEGDNAGKKVYVVYDRDLTADQKTCLDNRIADGMNEPPVVRIYDNHSPDTIDSAITAATLVAKSAAMAEKTVAPAEDDSYDENSFYGLSDDCPDDEDVAKTAPPEEPEALEVF